MGGNCDVMPHYNLMMFNLTRVLVVLNGNVFSVSSALAVWDRVLSVLVTVWFCTAYDDGQLRVVCVCMRVCVSESGMSAGRAT